MTLMEQLADPEHWDSLVQRLMVGGVSHEEAFAVVLGAFFELHEAAATDQTVEDAELVTH